MKLKLITLAVGAVMAGAASAQTANVTLYGLVDANIASVRTQGAGSALVVSSGGRSGSRWGLRGSESLGGGLNAIFTLEGGYNVDTGSMGAGAIFARQAFVGVAGGFGSLTLGRQYSPSFHVICGSSIEGCASFSVEVNHYLSIPGALRVDNSINFKSSNMGGLTVAAMYGAGEAVGGLKKNRLMGVNAEYNNGPIYAGLGWVDKRDGVGNLQARHWIVGGKYNAGVATVAAAYLNEKASSFKGWHVDVGVPFGATTLIAQFGQGKAGAARQRLINVGADYNLSKRSNLYFRFANADNNAASNLNAFGVGAAPTAGNDKRIIAAGLRHKF
ncbi:MAG: porin [Casimicrobiaceae bacterium]